MSGPEAVNATISAPIAAPRILVFAGSARKESWNRKLAVLAAAAVRSAGADTTLLELADYDMPLYHGDLEAREGLPQAARQLKGVFAEHAALFIVSPENNASVSSLLKNTIDWLSRAAPGDPDPFAGKIAAVAAASTGMFGGVRGLVHLRAICQTLGVTVLAQQVTVPRAEEAFTPEGALKDPRTAGMVAKVAALLVAHAKALKK